MLKLTSIHFKIHLDGSRSTNVGWCHTKEHYCQAGILTIIPFAWNSSDTTKTLWIKLDSATKILPEFPLFLHNHTHFSLPVHSLNLSYFAYIPYLPVSLFSFLCFLKLRITMMQWRFMAGDLLAWWFPGQLTLGQQLLSTDKYPLLSIPGELALLGKVQYNKQVKPFCWFSWEVWILVLGFVGCGCHRDIHQGTVSWKRLM